MAWQSEMITIVRTLISDLGPNYTYNDLRIKQSLVVAAKYVQFDVVIEPEFTVDVSNLTISPDPTADEINNQIFISLTCLKAACLIDQSNYRTKAGLEGIRAALGPASLSVGGSLAGWKAILDHGACAAYSAFTEHWDVANASAVRAIFSPFVGNHFDPQNLRNPNFDYSRYQGNEYY
jgi:hypothetical protein